MKQIALLIPLNVEASMARPRTYAWYPSPELMNSVQWVLAVHSQELLSQEWRKDDEAQKLLEEFLDEQRELDT